MKRFEKYIWVINSFKYVLFSEHAIREAIVIMLSIHTKNINQLSIEFLQINYRKLCAREYFMNFD